jgi:hypothetical protein
LPAYIIVGLIGTVLFIFAIMSVVSLVIGWFALLLGIKKPK